ncbi:uncharacterized protein [Dysidea avara]|uniref:uncharacterized protein n=1 Tax=Dysidea avara TaxID=196820 RepID=UPI00331A3D9F
MQVLLLVSAVLFAVSDGKINQTMVPCKTLCITANDKHLEGYDPTLSPVFLHKPRCAVIYNMESCYYRRHTHGDDTECQPLCLPSSYKIITRQLRTGPREFTIPEDCQFTYSVCKQCKRQSNIVKFFESSRYEKEVDVGRCIGSCNGVDHVGTDLSHCVSVENETISIPNPNGITAVSVIKQCSCEASCYRFSYLEAFLERNDSNHPAVQEKIIDVGRCVGSCNNVIPGKCLSRDKKTGACLYSFSARRAVCRPSIGEDVRFINVDGKIMTIPVVKKCGCISG